MRVGLRVGDGWWGRGVGVVASGDGGGMRVVNTNDEIWLGMRG